MLGNPLRRYRRSLEHLEIWRLSEPGTFDEDVLVWEGEGLLDDEFFADVPGLGMEQISGLLQHIPFAYVPFSATVEAKDLLGLTVRASRGRQYMINACEIGRHWRLGAAEFWYLSLQPQDRTGHGEVLEAVF